MIWSYSQRFEEIKTNYKLKEFLFVRESIDDIVSRMEQPAVLGVSCYSWTSNYNIMLAEKVKQKWPDCIIIAGGPDVGKTDDEYFKNTPFMI